MRARPHFSIITVCLNDKPNLIKTAESVRLQSSEDWEWVVIDGASSDGTREYLESLELSGLRWISEPDDGIYDAFNKGAELSHGDYLIYICAGDRFCERETLEKVAKFMSANPGQDIYYADSFEVDEQGNRYLRLARDHNKIWWNLFTHHQAIFYAKSCFDSARYNEDYRIGGDYAFTAELLHMGATAAKMPFTTAEFLLGGTSQQNYWKAEAENWDARRNLGVPLVNRAAIYATHALIRWGRTLTPSLYRLFRYSSNTRNGWQAEPTETGSDGNKNVSTMAPYQVAGVQINCDSLGNAIELIMEEKKTDRAFSVYTLNLDHVSQLRKNTRFRKAYSRARFTLPDGFPIALAGRLAGRDVTRACGSDLIEPLCKQAAQADMSVFLLGSTNLVLADCAEQLAKKAPGLKIAGLHAPPFGFEPFSEQADDVIDIIKKSNADFCFIALGAPRQELFAARCLDRLDGTALICIGASLDFITGAQRRAPSFFQNFGMEWLWRLAGNPTRLAHRYLLSAYVLPSVLIASLTENRRPGISGSEHT